MAAHGRLADSNAGGQVCQADGALAADDGQQSIGSGFHVRMDLAGKLVRDGTGAAPEQAQLVFNLLKGIIHFVALDGSGRCMGERIAHGNHSRVRRHERLYP
ncbi:hypothetical protein NicSoilE8_14000 [Arthrobacter sp. NicSoilE8]|nr:hypothetical protein NicSoilE8_14000 [Arthrobacter sp. NicSoilE8]